VLFCARRRFRFRDIHIHSHSATFSAKYNNTLAAILAISASEGTGALFKGCFLNWVKLAPSAGLSFYFYEVAKDALGLNEQLPAAAAADAKAGAKAAAKKGAKAAAAA
jgi:hypothetical protein